MTIKKQENLWVAECHQGGVLRRTVGASFGQAFNRMVKALEVVL